MLVCVCQCSSSYLRASLCPSASLESPYSAPEETLYQLGVRPAEEKKTRAEVKQKEKERAGVKRAGGSKEVRESLLFRLIHPEIMVYQHEPHYLLCNSTNLLCSDRVDNSLLANT